MVSLLYPLIGVSVLIPLQLMSICGGGWIRDALFIVYGEPSLYLESLVACSRNLVCIVCEHLFVATQTLATLFPCVLSTHGVTVYLSLCLMSSTAARFILQVYQI